MKNRHINSIPSEAEFEAASKSMAARIRSEEKIKKQIISQCGHSPIVHDVYVWLPEGRCHVDLFVNSDNDIQSHEAKRMKDLIVELLATTDNGNRRITVELDSHERVLREFNGNYFNRFR